jgi:hypothetical protein
MLFVKQGKISKENRTISTFNFTETTGEAFRESISRLASKIMCFQLIHSSPSILKRGPKIFPHLHGLSKHVITIIKQQAKPFIVLTQEGKFITHLVVGVGVRDALCALHATGAQHHGAEVISSEAAQPAQVLGRLPSLVMITFIFTTA